MVVGFLVLNSKVSGMFTLVGTWECLLFFSARVNLLFGNTSGIERVRIEDRRLHNEADVITCTFSVRCKERTTPFC